MTETTLRAALLAEGVDAITIDGFIAWHKANPIVWREFEAIALDEIAAGTQRWGAKAVAEIVRWKIRKAGGGDYKLANNYVAYYARAFAAKHPQHAKFFEYRQIAGLRRVQ